MNRETVLRVAALSETDPAAVDINAFSEDMKKITDMFDLLRELPPAGTVISDDSVFNVFRSDEVKPSLSRGDALKNSVGATDTAFSVPKAVD